jgi:hypothetical protein
MMPSGYDFEPVVNAEPAPPPPPRFTRDQLDATGQKIFDQLKQQREMVEEKAGADEANKHYTNISGLNPDETLAMMAQELQSTGITDIYKVKQDIQRIPVTLRSEESSEGGSNFITYFADGANNVVPDESKVKRDEQGNYYYEKPQFINTETNQPLVTSVGLGEFQNDPGILTDMAVGKRQFSGTGLKFTDDGVPFYYSTGLKKDSNITSFLKGAAPVLGMAAGLLAGPAGLKLGALASGAIGGGVSGLLGSGGELDEALKSAALGAAMAYGSEAVLGALPSTPSALDAGMGTYDVSGFNPVYDAIGVAGLGDPTAGFGGMPSYYSPGEAGIDQILRGTGDLASAAPPTPDYVDDLFSGAGAPTPDVVYPDLVAPPTLPTPAWDTGYPTKPEVPLGSLEPTYGPTMDPSLGDPTAGYGGMPKTPNFLEETLAGLGAGAKALLNTPGGRLLLSGIVTTLAANESPSGPGTGTGSGPQGWSGQIPQYAAIRERVPLSDAGRRPGEYGRRYFSDTAYVPLKSGESNLGANIENVANTKKLLEEQAQELGRGVPNPLYSGIASVLAQPRSAPATAQTPSYPTSGPTTPPTQGTPFVWDDSMLLSGPGFGVEPNPARDAQIAASYNNPDQLNAIFNALNSMPTVNAAAGGLMGLAKGRYLNGTTDGMEDKLPANIDGQQPARLSHGEFVIPADVVSHLGNGNSQAGAKRLYEMMDKIRHARTGTKKQGKQINADKYLPV